VTRQPLPFMTVENVALKQRKGNFCGETKLKLFLEECEDLRGEGRMERG